MVRRRPPVERDRRVRRRQPVRLTCGFLYACTGYYRYDEGFRPEFPGEDRFAGPIVHPQHWPADLDHAGKRVVVIGSGATAVTLVPALAKDAGARDDAAALAELHRRRCRRGTRSLEKLHRWLPDRLATRVGRGKNMVLQIALYQFAQRAPKAARRVLQGGVRRQLPPGYPVEKHFRPAYDPWDQRLCLVPDGDLFAAIRAGRRR